MNKFSHLLHTEFQFVCEFSAHPTEQPSLNYEAAVLYVVQNKIKESAPELGGSLSSPVNGLQKLPPGPVGGKVSESLWVAAGVANREGFVRLWRI